MWCVVLCVVWGMTTTSSRKEAMRCFGDGEICEIARRILIPEKYTQMPLFDHTTTRKEGGELIAKSCQFSFYLSLVLRLVSLLAGRTATINT